MASEKPDLRLPSQLYGSLPNDSPVTGTKLYSSMTEAYVRERLAQGCYPTAARPGFEPATVEPRVRRRPNRYTTMTPGKNVKQALPKVIWQEHVALTQLRYEVPNGYCWTPKIHPQNCPFPSTITTPSDTAIPRLIQLTTLNGMRI